MMCKFWLCRIIGHKVFERRDVVGKTYYACSRTGGKLPL